MYEPSPTRVKVRESRKTLFFYSPLVKVRSRKTAIHHVIALPLLDAQRRDSARSVDARWEARADHERGIPMRRHRPRLRSHEALPQPFRRQARDLALPKRRVCE